jgi:hypothetical protein
MRQKASSFFRIPKQTAIGGIRSGGVGGAA